MAFPFDYLNKLRPEPIGFAGGVADWEPALITIRPPPGPATEGVVPYGVVDLLLW